MVGIKNRGGADGTGEDMSACLPYYRLCLVGRRPGGVPMYVTAMSLLQILQWDASRSKGSLRTLRAKNLRQILEDYAKEHGCRCEIHQLTFRHLMRVARLILEKINLDPPNGDIHIIRVSDILRADIGRVLASFL
jgi:hypothetical protein